MSVSLRMEVYSYIFEKYSAEPEYLWKSVPDYAVFRHENNRKWFALIMNIPKSKLGPYSDDIVDILNLKLSSPMDAELMAKNDGIFPGYHISKGGSWISVLLDGTVKMESIKPLIDESYGVTAVKIKRKIAKNTSD